MRSMRIAKCTIKVSHEAGNRISHGIMLGRMITRLSYLLEQRPSFESWPFLCQPQPPRYTSDIDASIKKLGIAISAFF